MVLKTFADNCTGESTQLRIRLVGKVYDKRDDCEFVYHRDRDLDYELGYWNGATEEKKAPNGTPWKYCVFEFACSYDENNILVYVSEPKSDWKPYYGTRKNAMQYN